MSVAVTLLTVDDAYNMLSDCMKRMCESDNHEEIVSLFVSANIYLHDLYMINHYRLDKTFG